MTTPTQTPENKHRFDSHRFCVAPMLDWTDRYCRFFFRLLSKHARLYTEMVTTGALIHGDRARHLDFNKEEHPVALQLGGSQPLALAQCAKMAEEWGYDEVNLNVGCPSDRVQGGNFGACLMLNPELVADCVQAMQEAVKIPITVKHRIGVDEVDSYDALLKFVDLSASRGCETFIVHARKAWLKGLSPKENREIPPLHYDVAYRLKQDFPQLNIVVNGGIASMADCHTHLKQLDGVMLGREIYHNPYFLALVDAELFADQHSVPSRLEVIQQMISYIEREKLNQVPFKHIARHLLGLYHQQPGARSFRRHLSENMPRKDSGIELLLQAAAFVKTEDSHDFQARSA